MCERADAGRQEDISSTDGRLASELARGLACIDAPGQMQRANTGLNRAEQGKQRAGSTTTYTQHTSLVVLRVGRNDWDAILESIAEKMQQVLADQSLAR